MAALSSATTNREYVIWNKQQGLAATDWYLYALSSLQMGRRECLSCMVYWGP